MQSIMDTSGTDLDYLLNLYVRIDEKMKIKFDESLDVALATLTSLRKVMVVQRRKWKDIINPTEFHMGKYGQLLHDKNFMEYIAQLHKDSEVVEHMINRIEMDIETAKRNQAGTLPTYRPSPDSVSVSASLPSTNGKGKQND